jgi:uridine nucleosidase
VQPGASQSWSIPCKSDEANGCDTALSRDVFGIIEGPPLHDPLAVAAVLTGTKWEIPFYESDPNSSSDSPNKRERFAVKVITEGTHDDALHRGSQLGRTIATLLPAGEEGVRIPRGLDTTKFWQALEECVQRADEANIANANANANAAAAAAATATAAPRN